MFIRRYYTENGEEKFANYFKLSNLAFNTATDMASSSIPVNDFSVDVVTDDLIDIGQFVELRDDNSDIWATYWVVSAQRISDKTLRINCQSNVALLDRVELPAKMYSVDDVDDVLNEIIPLVLRTEFNVDYTLDSSFSNEVITGFCPRQTARERLKWVCFVIGAYVRTSFNWSNIDILPIDDETETIIPMRDIYWAPTVIYKDWVTAITMVSYAFERTLEIEAQDEYVEDANGTYYLVTKTELTLTNPNAPAYAPDNVVRIDDVMLINNDNVSDILTHLSRWYFNHMDMDFEAINNGDYKCGDKVLAYADESTIMRGFINSANFTFGVQSKARMRITAVQNVTGAKLEIFYMYQTTHIGWNEFYFPVGYEYSVTNPFNDLYLNDHFYVYRPLNEAATGTMVAGDNTNTQYYAIALDLYDGVLHIISVDDVEQDVDLDTDTAIGVIS